MALQTPSHIASCDGRLVDNMIITQNHPRQIHAFAITKEEVGPWLRSLLEPESLLQSELEEAKQGGLNTQLTIRLYPPDPNPQRVLVVDTKVSDGSAEPGKAIKSLAASDNRRIYRFDAKGKRLLGLEVYAHTSRGDVLLLETTQIEYDQPIDPGEVRGQPARFGRRQATVAQQGEHHPTRPSPDDSSQRSAADRTFASCRPRCSLGNDKRRVA